MRRVKVNIGRLGTQAMAIILSQPEIHSLIQISKQKQNKCIDLTQSYLEFVSADCVEKSSGEVYALTLVIEETELHSVNVPTVLEALEVLM